jgi:hypothetical protein
MKILAEHILKRLEGHKFCSVFESELTRVWPKKSDKRKQAIREFAEKHGLAVVIHDPGLRAVFKKPPKR